MRCSQLWASLVILVLLTLFAASCGGGGSSAVNAISGQVLAPGGAAMFTRSLPGAAAGVPVTLGTMNDDGTVFTAITDASTFTDDTGHYSIPLPAGTALGPRLNVVVGDPAAPTLSSIVLDSTTDIRPASAAARDELYTLARAQGTAISALNTTKVRAFLSAALAVGIPQETGATLDDAVNACHTTLAATPAVTTALQAIVPASALQPTRLQPDYGEQGKTTRVTISGFGLSPAPTITDNGAAPQVTTAIVSAAANSLVVDFTVPAGAAPGFHYCTMRRPVAGQADLVAQIAFFVRTPTDPPNLTDISPAIGTVSATSSTVVDVTLTGMAFDVPGATIQFSAGAIEVTAVRVVSPTQITATFTIPANHQLGNFLVSVRTASGTSPGVIFCLVAAVAGGDNHPHPRVTSISPSSYTMPINAVTNQQVRVHLTGSSFVGPLSVTPFFVDNTSPIYTTNVRNATATSCDVTLVIKPDFRGPVAIGVRNGDASQVFSNQLNFTVR